jgi:adenylate cyclase
LADRNAHISTPGNLAGVRYDGRTCMEVPSQKPPQVPTQVAERELLDSWKEVAAYLRRSERTVRRWEVTEGLPVHRHLHRKRGTVFCYKSEIDRWWTERGSRLTETGQTEPAREDEKPRRTLAISRHGILLMSVALTVLVAASVGLLLIGKPPDQAVSLTPTRSLAVLPLRNLSGDPAQEYFADGMTEALISELARIPQLKVISRTSVMRYKNVDTPVPKIAAELGVEGVIEGSAVRAGDHVRITVQLIDGVSDKHLWANTYEREAQRVLALQIEVARGIAEGIRVQLQPQTVVWSKATPVKPDAHDAYLRGLFLMDRVTREAISEAIKYFHRSVDIDPGYASAYVGLADAYGRSAIRAYLSPREAYPLAKAAALRAVQLDDDSADAHTLLGVIRFRWDWDWSGAERELKRAMELGPGSSRVRLGYGTYLLTKGQFAQAVSEGTRAVELDPLSPQRSVDLVWKLDYTKQRDMALEQLQKTFALSPDFAPAFSARASVYAALGRHADAVADCNRALQLAGEEQWLLESCGSVYALAGRQREVAQVLDRFKRLSSEGYVDSYYVALLYSSLSKPDDAEQWLERAYNERSANLCHLRIDVNAGRFALNSHTRDLLRRINFASDN